MSKDATQTTGTWTWHPHIYKKPKWYNFLLKRKLRFMNKAGIKYGIREKR